MSTVTMIIISAIISIVVTAVISNRYRILYMYMRYFFKHGSIDYLKLLFETYKEKFSSETFEAAMLLYAEYIIEVSAEKTKIDQITKLYGDELLEICSQLEDESSD